MNISDNLVTKIVDKKGTVKVKDLLVYSGDNVNQAMIDAHLASALRNKWVYIEDQGEYKECSLTVYGMNLMFGVKYC